MFARCARLANQVRRDRVPGCVGDVQHATERMTAFLGQMEVTAVTVERDAPANELGNGFARMTHDVPDGFFATQTRAGVQRVLHVFVFAVDGVGDGGDAALRPVGGTGVEFVFREHRDASREATNATPRQARQHRCR